MEKLGENNQSKSDLQIESETEDSQAGTQSRDINNTFTTATQGENEQMSIGQRRCGSTDSEKFSNSEISKGESVQPDKTGFGKTEIGHGKGNPLATGIESDSKEQKSLYSAALKRKIPPPQSPSPQLTPVRDT